MIGSATSLSDRPSLEHLRTLLGPAGVTQFGNGPMPDASSGTCLDDNARALIVAVFALAADPDYPQARRIGDSAMAFVEGARRSDGKFHNMADYDGRFLDNVGSEESIGRTAWACGIAARCATVPEWRASALWLLDASIPVLLELRAIHARAYALLGLIAAVAPNTATPVSPIGGALPRPAADAFVHALTALAEGLARDFDAFAIDDWPWWTPTLTWGNARLPEAMVKAASVTGKHRYADIGMRALAFLGKVTHDDDVFVPIGNLGWYARGGTRALYDQQPIEACAMVDAWLAAHRLTGEDRYRRKAASAFEWFRGGNTEGIPVADPLTGGCCDGLQQGRVNLNQGAESTLSYVHAAFALRAG